MGHPGTAPQGYADYSYRRVLSTRAHRHREPAVRVDVCIVGSGFGGSISAFRLAELYRAAGPGARASWCSSAASATCTPTSGSRWTSSMLARAVRAGPGPRRADRARRRRGRQLEPLPRRVAALAERDLRAPRPPPERRARPAHVAARDHPRRRSTPTTSAPSRRCAFSARRGTRWRSPGGLWAATLAAAGHTCDRVPQAIDLSRCIQAKWCHTGLHLRGQELGDHELPRVRREPRRGGAAELAGRARSRQSAARPYRYVVTASEMDNEGPTRPASRPAPTFDVECKVLILAAGAMGNSPLLMRSRPRCRASRRGVGKHLGVNGDHIAAIEYDERKVRDVLGLPGLRPDLQGQPHHDDDLRLVGRPQGNANDGKRFTLQEIYLSQLAHTLYDDGRAPAGEPSWWGLQKKQALSTFNNHVEILAMVEDTHDGEFLAPPPTGSHIRPNAGPVGIGPFNYTLSEQSAAGARGGQRGDPERGRAQRPRAADAADLPQRQRRPSARRLPHGGLEGLRRRGPPRTRCSATRASSAWTRRRSRPRSGVNPSLTISAVAERAVEQLIARSARLLACRPAPRDSGPGVPGCRSART